jgi:arylsulfatase A-like enzyme
MRASRKALLSLIAFLACGAGLYYYLAPGKRDARPNIILISIDSLRYDHLGCYGYSRDTSPTIDRLAREGALFETAVSSTSWTLPAHAALFTGLPDRVHGCFDDQQWLDGSRHTLAEALQEAGYRTVGFFSGPYLHPSFGLSQGFERYQDCTSYSPQFIERVKKDELLNEQGIIGLDLMGLSHEDITNPIVLAEVEKWLAGKPRGPFFLFIHLWDVHYDYIPPPPYDTMFVDPGYTGPVDGRNLLRAFRKPAGWIERDVDHLKALYDGEIRYTDDTLGKILAALERAGHMERSIIAVTADHGEAFYEHGHFGHRWTLHEEEVRIPLIVQYPAVVPKGQRIQRPARIIDIAPTLLDLAGLPPMPHAMGRSLAPLLTGKAGDWADETAVCELTVPANGIESFALRDAAWKVIIDLKKRSENIFVFDLEKDPGERRSLGVEESPLSAAKIGALYTEIARRLSQAAAALPAIGERDTPPISKMTEAQLRANGYLR